MAKINSNYRKLAAGYLFPEIARRQRAFEAKNPGVSLMRLGIGNTTEPLTPAVLAGLHKGVDNLSERATYTGYGDEQGLTALREALQVFYAGRGVNLGVDEFFVSDGAKSDVGNLQSIFSTDNVVAIQDPAYPVYVDSNVIFGRTGDFLQDLGQYGGIVYMPSTQKEQFVPKPPQEHVDLIYLCSPNNPTGAVMSHAELAEFVAYAKEHKSVIIFDAAYSEYISDPTLPRSIYEIEGAQECAIEINSLSKFAGFTGVRLGWTIVPKALMVEDSTAGEVNALWNRRQCTFFNGASNVVQAGALAVFSEAGLQESRELVAYYMENARIIRTGLLKKGFSVTGGDNAPYLWLQTPKGVSSWEFFDTLMKRAHVIGTPGSGFGPGGEGYFRLSAFGHREDIVRAVQSIVDNL